MKKTAQSLQTHSPRRDSRYFPRLNQEQTSMESSFSREATQTVSEKQSPLWISIEAEHTSSTNANQFWALSDTRYYDAATGNSFQRTPEAEYVYVLNDNFSLTPTDIGPVPATYANPIWFPYETGQFYAYNGNSSFALPGHPYSANNVTSPGLTSTIKDFLNAASTDTQGLANKVAHQPLLQHEAVTNSNWSLPATSRFQTGLEARHQPMPPSINENRFYIPPHNPARNSSLPHVNPGILMTRTHHFYPSKGRFLWHNKVNTLQCHTYTHEGRNILASLNTTIFEGQELFFLTALDIGYTRRERRFKYEATVTGDSKFQSYIGNCHTLSDSLWDIVSKRNCLSFSLKDAHAFETSLQAGGVRVKGFRILIDTLSY